ncbi:MAG: F0F1 ATP synthase subunit A [Acidobacteria bacterium]|jgi:F-type H+-transporting ATPase subunit a|nr:F0F1 ATP synthase subunit A [Acidobacteriota bacterium]
MEHNPLFAVWINGLLRSVAGLAGIRVHGDPLPAHVIMAFIATLALVLFFKLTVKNLSLFPARMQAMLESIYLFFRSTVDDMIGHEGRKFIPVLGTLGLFIASCNLLGLLPEMASPTANLNVPAGCAIFIFLYYHAQGVKKHGFFGYLKTFAGPKWWLSWLFFPIEFISHFSRPMSLTVRLFCNIFGEDLVIIIIVSLVPFVAPLPMMAMAIFTSLLQAYIFIMLSSVYLAGAIASEH